MESERGVVHISSRFPRELAETLRRLAQEHARSINGEVVRAVRADSMRQHKPRTQDGAGEQP